MKFSFSLITLSAYTCSAFLPQNHVVVRPVTTMLMGEDNAVMGETKIEEDDLAMKRKLQKQALFGLLGNTKQSSSGKVSGYVDPVLADPVTKAPVTITTSGPVLGGLASTSGVKVSLSSQDNEYMGRTNTYYNLLAFAPEDANDESDETSSGESVPSEFLNQLRVFVPPPLRGILPNGGDYIPMRDLFTSPSVSFAYERGWRQGFAAAGFPGADKEYEMVRDFFEPVEPKVVVDMSCATGLFTRRLAKSNDYNRVIACDYSDSMLLEARNRIRADPDLSSQKLATTLDLVRCDVGDIPMQEGSVDALHAGAAMHCWPDLDSAMTEIYRVLKPGGRFFTTTFLAAYFSNVQGISGESVQEKAFQYFESVDVLRDIVKKGGFSEENIDIEVLGAACVVIRVKK